LLIHGARVVLCHLRRKSQPGWALTLAQRRPLNVVAVAMANKMARTVWAVLAQDRAYDRGYVSVRPAWRQAGLAGKEGRTRPQVATVR